MAENQASLFDQRKYKGVMPQTYQIEPPAADHTVLKTLLAYHTYLRSGGYSKYTPDDFTSDVKKFGLFVKDKKIKDIKLVDIQQWIGEIKRVMKEKTVSRKYQRSLITSIGLRRKTYSQKIPHNQSGIFG